MHNFQYVTICLSYIQCPMGELSVCVCWYNADRKSVTLNNDLVLAFLLQAGLALVGVAPAKPLWKVNLQQHVQ